MKKKLCVLATGLFIAFIVAGSVAAQDSAEPAETAPADAYVVPIHGEINPFLVVFVRRGINSAVEAGAEYIIFDIDTFGGRVDSALQITTLIGSADATTVAYVPSTAEGTGVSWSAGALISFACDMIYMASGTSIGAAAPVIQTQSGMEMADEKTVSAVRTQMAALAEKNGYPKAVALAMVDLDVELQEVYVNDEVMLVSSADLPSLERRAEREGFEVETGKVVSAAGKLLTLTAGEMAEYSVSSGTMDTRADLYRLLELDEDRVTVLRESMADRAAAFVTGGVLTGLLTLIGLVALYLEITSPGFGVPGTVAIIAFAVVFLSSAMLGTVGSLELLLFIAGVVLLIVEIFLIPGFGVTGVSGIILMAAALVLSRQDFVWPEFEWEWDVFRRNLSVVGLSVVASIVGFGVIVKMFPHLPLFNRLILASPDQTVSETTGRIENDTSQGAGVQSGTMVYPAHGARGIAVTPLRPVGKAEIGGELHDVKADAEFLERGADVEVVEVRGNRILVRKV